MGGAWGESDDKQHRAGETGLLGEGSAGVTGSASWILYAIAGENRRDIVSNFGTATQYGPAVLRVKREVKRARRRSSGAAPPSIQGSWSARTIRSPYTAATWLPGLAWNFTVTAGLPCTSATGTAYVTS